MISFYTNRSHKDRGWCWWNLRSADDGQFYMVLK